jgi:16S rRNA (guanine527-N7)-methyltransferase
MRRFPEDAWAWFAGVCEEMGRPVDAERRRSLERLYSHLVGVNAWMNLTRITAPRDYLKFHVLDSLTILPDVEAATRAGDTCVDLGSGGGYPGCPLMLWLPDRKWVLVDSRRKKAAFLAQAVKLTGCRAAEARAFRGNEAASAAPDLAGRSALVVARAVGSVSKLMPEAAPLLVYGGRLIVMKGPAYDDAERDAVRASARSHGFEQVDEVAVRLEEGDPERLIIVFVRK